MLNEEELKIAKKALNLLTINCKDHGMTALEFQYVNNAISKLESFINGDIIADTWEVDDVYSIVGDSQETTEGQAREVLRVCHDHMDANYGINWEVLETTLDYVLEEEEKLQAA